MLAWKSSFVISKIFKKLINNRPFDHLEKCKKCGFRSSHVTGYLLKVVGERIAGVFIVAGCTRTGALGLWKARVWHASLFYKLTSHGISRQVFSLISSFRSNRLLLEKKSLQECSIHAGAYWVSLVRLFSC